MRKETPLLVPFFPILVQNQIKSARFRYPDTLAELLDLKNTVRFVDTLARVKGTQGTCSSHILYDCCAWCAGRGAVLPLVAGAERGTNCSRPSKPHALNVAGALGQKVRPAARSARSDPCAVAVWLAASGPVPVPSSSWSRAPRSARRSAPRWGSAVRSTCMQ